MHASKKHCMYLCNFIKGKKIDDAITLVKEVADFKRPIPFKGEIPHRHELGGRPGRFPVNAAKQFVYLLKALKGNAIANGLALENSTIVSGVTNWAQRPQRKGGGRFKRVHVVLTIKEKENKK